MKFCLLDSCSWNQGLTVMEFWVFGLKTSMLQQDFPQYLIIFPFITIFTLRSISTVLIFLQAKLRICVSSLWVKFWMISTNQEYPNNFFMLPISFRSGCNNNSWKIATRLTVSKISFILLYVPSLPNNFVSSLVHPTAENILLFVK